jgi:hypothetical protein
MITIPGKTTCPQLWTREYQGYLMSDFLGANSRTMYICIDGSMESVPGSQSSAQSSSLHHVEANCGETICPPSAYDEEKELTCVVCSNHVADL